MIANPLNQRSDSFVFEQVTPLAIWSIDHGLGRIGVNVTLYDLDGNLFFADVRVLNSNTIAVVATAPCSGRAVIR